MSHTPSPVLLAFFTAALISLFLTTYSIRKGLRKEFVQRNYQTAVFFSAIALLMVLAGGKLDNVFIVTAFYAGFSSVALFLLSLRGKLASLAPVYLQGMRLHRWVGNPVLSCVGRAVSGAAVGDFHCGLRGVRRDDVLRLGLRADGMEFASEMILTAAAHGLRIVEVPTTLAPDGRDRPPHLRTWRDGWRHLRLLLLLAPRWLFLYPGAAAAVAGGLLVAMLAPGPVRVGGVMFDVHTMLLGAALLAVGLQGVLLAVIAEAYGAAVGLWPTSSSRRALLDGWSVERGLIAGGALVTAGVGVALAETMWWADAGFGPLDVFRRDLILAVVAMVTGSQVASAGFLVGLARLGLERMDEPGPPPWAEWTPDERG